MSWYVLKNILVVSIQDIADDSPVMRAEIVLVWAIVPPVTMLLQLPKGHQVRGKVFAERHIAQFEQAVSLRPLDVDVHISVALNGDGMIPRRYAVSCWCGTKVVESAYCVENVNSRSRVQDC